MRNVAPTRALARRSLQVFQISIPVILLGSFLAAAAIAMYTIDFVVPANPGYGAYNLARGLLLLLGGGVILAGFVLLLRAVTWKRDNDLARLTAERLGERLDDSYTFIRNVSKIGLGYIDAVLVGPPGVLVCRILDSNGTFLNEGPNWLVKDRKGQWSPLHFNPTREAVADIKNLGEWLTRRDVKDVPIFGIVVFVNESARLEPPKNPTVPVTTLRDVVDTLLPNFLAKQRIDTSVTQKLLKLLHDS